MDSSDSTKNDKVQTILSPAELWLPVENKNEPVVKRFVEDWLEKNPDGIINWVTFKK